ncbi:MAG: lysozyme inhibitor LprI family protein [Chthoniobacterales bacterium]
MRKRAEGTLKVSLGEFAPPFSHRAVLRVDFAMFIRQRLVLVLGALLLGALAPLSAQTRSDIIPEDWLPALAPAIKSQLEQLRDAQAQGTMNRLSREVAETTDAQLFIAYVRLYERLSPKERTKLFHEQETWLKKRPKIAKAGIESEGGSLAPLEANNAEITYTEKRLAELRARLKAHHKKSDAEE